MSHDARADVLPVVQLAAALVRAGSRRAVDRPLTSTEASTLSALLKSSSYQAAINEPHGPRAPQEWSEADAFEHFARDFNPGREIEPQLAEFDARRGAAAMSSVRADNGPEHPDPVQALNRLSEIATGFIPAQWLRTACNLRLFDHLSTGSLTVDELAGALAIKPEACASFLQALAELKLLEREQDRWRNTDLGRLLTSTADVPLNTLGTWVDIFYPMWQFLEEALREGTPRYEQAFHTSAAKTWEALFADADRLRLFCRFMNAYSIPIGRQIAEQFSFDPIRRVLDVAGGAGGLSAQIALRYPHLHGVVMDLPPVCAIAREYIAGVGLSDRLTTVAADLFDGPYPGGTDAVILSWILHDWSDDKCRIILRHCFDALEAGGTLLISEIAMRNDGAARPFGNIMNMHMLIACDPGARERSESEYRQLLTSVGFQDIEVALMSGPRDLIIARKP